MRHVEKALLLMAEEKKRFIELDNVEDVPGISPVVKFTIQSDPIKQVGVNGVQAVDMLEYVKYLFQSLDEAFPCLENANTINLINEAIVWQKTRTADRVNRGVEGMNLP